MLEHEPAKNAGHHSFTWSGLGDIRKGRSELGEEMPVLVYRLMQYTMLDVLSRKYGAREADEHFRSAGFLAGQEFAKNVLDLNAPFNRFLTDLQRSLKELKIGILRMESFNDATGEIVLTVGEDLDCSGLPVTGESVCCYDEGFLSGLLEAYTGKRYAVREIDCWANGDRVCRFQGVVV